MFAERQPIWQVKYCRKILAFQISRGVHKLEEPMDQYVKWWCQPEGTEGMHFFFGRNRVAIKEPNQWRRRANTSNAKQGVCKDRRMRKLTLKIERICRAIGKLTMVTHFLTEHWYIQNQHCEVWQPRKCEGPFWTLQPLIKNFTSQRVAPH